MDVISLPAVIAPLDPATLFRSRIFVVIDSVLLQRRTEDAVHLVIKLCKKRLLADKFLNRTARLAAIKSGQGALIQCCILIAIVLGQVAPANPASDSLVGDFAPARVFLKSLSLFGLRQRGELIQGQTALAAEVANAGAIRGYYSGNGRCCICAVMNVQGVSRCVSRSSGKIISGGSPHSSGRMAAGCARPP